MANIACLHYPWRLVAKASDRIADLVTDIPGWNGYEYSDETQSDLQRAAALLRQAIPLLEKASDREAAGLPDTM